ncbi:hypothetical protein VCSRO128_3695 [Vibrio cholerae]|nr:hypothetical protein VCSRO128_3695 [Vibrio cholerae]
MFRRIINQCLQRLSTIAIAVKTRQKHETNFGHTVSQTKASNTDFVTCF